MIIYKVLFGLVLIKGKCLRGSAPGMISIPVWKLKSPKLALISNAWFPALSCQDFCAASMLQSLSDANISMLIPLSFFTLDLYL